MEKTITLSNESFDYLQKVLYSRTVEDFADDPDEACGKDDVQEIGEHYLFLARFGREIGVDFWDVFGNEGWARSAKLRNYLDEAGVSYAPCREET